MEIVIDIPEEKYKAITEMYETFPKDMKEWGLEAIKNGTPLPKGHGRLIDADKLLETAYQVYDAVRHMWTPDFVVNADDIEYAPTIIEADKESDTE